MSIQDAPGAGAIARACTSTQEDDIDTVRDGESARERQEGIAALERRILGLELCGDDALREMAITELAHDRLRFAAVHRLVQEEIEKEHARQIGVIRRAAIAANLRAREEWLVRSWRHTPSLPN